MKPESEIRGAVERMLAQFLDVGALAPDTDVFESGFINSLLALQMVYHLEEQFGFQIEEEDLERENFSSINNLTQFVARKQSACLAAE